ncbi:MAG TPA: hypothetical protein VK796_13670 [Cytophaga sp.]|jgi:hypothetical protein|nr:hypothetical protein [Cytophaga sp.]
MKYIISFFILNLLFSCNSKQRQQENALLFPDRYKYSFEVVNDIYYFPDVNIYFNFSCHPSKKTLIAIEAELKKFEEQYQKIFIHAMTKTEVEDQYLIPVNFNRIDFNNYSDSDMKEDVGLFEHLLKSIEANPDIQDLIAVKFK